MDKETLNFIKIARRMTSVDRCQGTPMNTPYSVTEHCAQAAIMYVGYCRSLKQDPNAILLEFILLHDVLEVFTGDVLYPAKHLDEDSWEYIECRVLDKVEQTTGVKLIKYTDYWISKEPVLEKLWKCCDTAELFCKCADEMERGNHTDALMDILDLTYNMTLGYAIPYFMDIVTEYSKDAVLALALKRANA